MPPSLEPSHLPDPVSLILIYCRPGFEKEGAAEIVEATAKLGVTGFVKTKADSGWLSFQLHDPEAARPALAQLRFADLVFARQMVFATPLLTDLPVGDRVTPLLQQASTLAPAFSQVWLETADTNEAKELSGFCRKFEKHFAGALKKVGKLNPDAPGAPRLHIFFLGSAAAHVGISWPENSAPWPMGILRLSMPRAAPSRSTLKLAEAIKVFQLEPRLQEGQTAVDLGASPGGWSWQLAERGIHVSAVDNGPMDKALIAAGMVEHLREDGFHFRPKRPVQWLVCDMIEQPARIAKLMADWLAEGHAQEAVFNLKLPMKRRHEELARCRELIQTRLAAARLDFELSFRQLYHDREEVTGHLQLLSAATYTNRNTQSRAKTGIKSRTRV